MLPAIVLDPSVFWMCSSEEDAETASEAIQKSCEWLSGVARQNTYVSDKMLQRLEESGFFPAEPHFKAVLERIGISEVFSAKQLAQMAARFLSNARFLEDDAPVRDLLFDDPSLNPDVLQPLDGALRGASELTLFLVAANSVSGRHAGVSYRYACPKLGDSTVSVSAECRVLGAVPSELEEVLGASFAADVGMIRSPGDYYRSLSADEVWANARTSEEIKLAVSLFAGKIAGESGGILRKFFVGEGFLGTLIQADAAGRGVFASVTLKKCAQLVANCGNIEVSDFRESASKRPRRRDFDDARAKRMHITDGHQALRLMFWERPCGSIELANVENKFDLSIFTGNPERAV